MSEFWILQRENCLRCLQIVYGHIWGAQQIDIFNFCSLLISVSSHTISKRDVPEVLLNDTKQAVVHR